MECCSLLPLFHIGASSQWNRGYRKSTYRNLPLKEEGLQRVLRGVGFQCTMLRGKSAWSEAGVTVV